MINVILHYLLLYCKQYQYIKINVVVIIFYLSSKFRGDGGSRNNTMPGNSILMSLTESPILKSLIESPGIGTTCLDDLPDWAPYQKCRANKGGGFARNYSVKRHSNNACQFLDHLDPSSPMCHLMTMARIPAPLA